MTRCKPRNSSLLQLNQIRTSPCKDAPGIVSRGVCEAESTVEGRVAEGDMLSWVVGEPGFLRHDATKLAIINPITRLRARTFRCIFLPNSNLRPYCTSPAETNVSDSQSLVLQAQRFSLPHSIGSKYTAILDLSCPGKRISVERPAKSGLVLYNARICFPYNSIHLERSNNVLARSHGGKTKRHISGFTCFDPAG